MMESPEAAGATSAKDWPEETGKHLEIRVLRALNEAATWNQALGNRFEALRDIAAAERVAKRICQTPAGKGKESPTEEAASIGDATGKDKAPRGKGNEVPAKAAAAAGNATGKGNAPGGQGKEVRGKAAASAGNAKGKGNASGGKGKDVPAGAAADPPRSQGEMMQNNIVDALYVVGRYQAMTPKVKAKAKAVLKAKAKAAIAKAKACIELKKGKGKAKEAKGVAKAAGVNGATKYRRLK